MAEEVIEDILKWLSEVLTKRNKWYTLAAEEVERMCKMRLLVDCEPLRMN